jgi:sugar/nucleoside kinase (ribokinase family)
MSISQCKMEIQTFLQQQDKECKVVVMPDFFLDRVISLEWGVAEFSGLVAGVAKRKGGSIDEIPQTDQPGGNAINVALALNQLGVKITPVVCTSEFGLQQIRYHFKSSPIDTSHIQTYGKASVTTALEFKNKEEKTNVMLRDLGSLLEFGPANLRESDYAAIADADYVCLFNWAGTVKFGTELAQAVFGWAKQSSNSKTYYDTADPTPNTKVIPDLMDKVLKTDKIDILSLNENEAITYASLLEEELKEQKELLGFPELAMKAARILAKHIPARIDLHTTDFSATLKGSREVVVPTFKVKVLRATGAGDAWCAGNILADHNGLSDECRLILANAVAACYLSDPEGQHPTKQRIANFLRTQP